MNLLKIILVALVTIVISLDLSAQDFIFTWEIQPSFSENYLVVIQDQDGRSKALVVKGNSRDTLTYSVDKDDIDTLRSFLDSYDFPRLGHREIDSVEKRYLETNFLVSHGEGNSQRIRDSTMVVVDSDTLFAGYVRLFKGYFLDSTNLKYYQRIEHGGVWTDGTTYEGRFQTSTKDQTYSLFSARFRERDLTLNEIILEIITKKERLLRYLEIQQEISSIRIRN